jgi:exonuclease III
MKDIILDIQIRNPNHSIILLGDFNITLENRDSAKRNVTAAEITARGILKDLMYDTNIRDCYREITPTGGFTWQRGNIMSRLDSSSSKCARCTTTKVDQNIVDSDHAGVRYG